MTIAKDGGVISERIDIRVTIMLQSGSTATNEADFEVDQLETVISLDPGVQSVDIPVDILDDQLPEGVESFTLTVSSAGFGFTPPRTDTFATTEVFITDNDGMVIFSTISSIICNSINAKV